MDEVKFRILTQMHSPDPVRSIAILLPDLRGGGAERVNLDLAHEFLLAGHNVEVVVMQARGEFLAEAQAAFPVIDLNCSRARRLPQALSRYFRTHRPDALLAAMWPLTVIAPLALRFSGHRCRIVVSEHGILSAQYRNWGDLHRRLLRLSTALGYRLADGRVGVSAGVVSDMAALSCMQNNAFDVVYNPIPSRPDPDSAALVAADRLWSGAKGARILTVGSMKAVKNHPLLLRAFARLDHLGARLMFVGDGVGKDHLLSIAEDLGLADRVIHAGFQPDPTPFYRTADLFVLSSNFEGFGNVIVESLGGGIPVVSTDCPSGPAEILENGKYGRLVPPGDAQALAEAMQAALHASHDPEFLKKRASDFVPAVAAKLYLRLLCP